MNVTLSKLPSLQFPATKAGDMSWAKRTVSSAAKKPSLSVVEAKKAIKLLKGVGKSIASIEVLPDGGFRIVATGQGAPTQEPINKFDVVLKS